MAEVPIILMLVGLAAYVVLGGADFGAGLWELFARGERGPALRGHTHRAMAPVWEANHVWVIFVITVCWTTYPTAFSSIASTLAIPLFAAAIGVILRGASYALRAGVSTPREEGALSVTFALSSVLTPFALGAVVGGIASGRVPVGNAQGDEISSWLNSTSVLIGVLAIATSAYLAAVYLAADATRMGSRDIAEDFRKRALVSGVAAGAIALAGPFVLRSDARDLYDGLTSGAGLVALAVSVLAGIAALALVALRRYEPARVVAAGAVATIVAGWALAQQPAFLPGLTVEQAAASDATITAVLIAIGLGTLILVPSLAYLFRLVLSGRFDPAAPLRPEWMASPAAPGRAGAVPAGDSPVPKPAPMAVAAAILAAGAAIAFVADDWLRGAGIALMLAAAVVLFPLLAGLDESGESELDAHPPQEQNRQ
jgi:cytochrome d ubiquinol oxidase subunit II